MKQHSSPKIIHIEEYQDKHQAAKRERQIKGWNKQKKLNIANLKKPALSVVEG